MAMHRVFLGALLLPLFISSSFASDDRGRPNILLIVAEDMSAHVGAFGDDIANTPNLDRLASEGVRFPNSFTVSGVCAPSRSGLITGVYPSSMGTHQMRTSGGGPIPYEAVPPASVKAFPELLRKSGYATANFAKKDYQFGEPFTVWDSDTGSFISELDPAIWRKLPNDKPFFAMVNLMATHESRLASKDAKFSKKWAGMMRPIQDWREKNVEKVTDLSSVKVPPYYPDTPQVRGSIAQHYDNIHYMDAQVGDILAALKEDGLDRNTIVIWTTDHGDAFPRAKRAVYDSGIKVPVIIRFPNRQGKGSVEDRLVSFVDIAPTILTIAGAPVPEFIQGQDFLGSPSRQYIYAARDRMDGVPDRQRAIRDSRFKYIRNYMSEVPYFRPLMFRDMFPVMRSLWEGQRLGILDGLQNQYFKAPRPPEELYDTESDPYEMTNLASDPEYSDVLQGLSDGLDRWLSAVGDMGDRPEIVMVREMWPDLIQPVTSKPKAEVGKDGLSLISSTKGASIGYRINGGPWLLYDSPIGISPKDVVDAKAIRYGYRESEVTTVIGKNSH